MSLTRSLAKLTRQVFVLYFCHKYSRYCRIQVDVIDIDCSAIEVVRARRQ